MDLLCDRRPYRLAQIKLQPCLKEKPGRAARSSHARPYILGSGVLVLLLAALPVVGNAIIWPLQTRFDRPKLPQGSEPVGIIALGGGMERIDEATALARAYPQAKLVISGNDGRPEGQFFVDNGVVLDRVIVEPKSQNTYENALLTTRLIRPKAGERWLLVTSASHMARAIGCFRKAGFLVQPWPVADVVRDWNERFSRAMHEWVGLLVYWLQGKTDSLFPSPSRS
jgi:uncharacterized SAM-binding protein YcdF (DUF218 family)